MFDGGPGPVSRWLTVAGTAAVVLARCWWTARPGRRESPVWPAAAGNLVGTEVSAVTLRARLATVGGVWVVSGGGCSLSLSPSWKDQGRLYGVLRLVERWHMGGHAQPL